MAQVIAELIYYTGWNLDEIGKMTVQQIQIILNALRQIQSGDQGKAKMNYAEACAIAGVQVPASQR